MKNGIDESINDLLDGIKEKYSDISLYSIEDINNVLDRIILEFNTLTCTACIMHSLNDVMVL